MVLALDDLGRAVEVTDEAVTDGVEAGVGQAQPLGEGTELQDPVRGVLHVVDPDVGQVQGQPGDGEEKHEGHHHLGDLLAHLQTRRVHRLALRVEVGEAVRSPPELLACQEADDQVKGDRDAVERDEQEHVVDLLEARVRPDLTADGQHDFADQRDFVTLVHEDERWADARGEHPHHRDGAEDLAAREEGAGVERAVDTIVSVHADDGQAQDAGRHGHRLREGHGAAQEVAVHPRRVDLVAQGDGHADEHHHQVAHGQVDQEAPGGADARQALASAPGQHAEGHDVAHEAYQEGEDVHGGKGDGGGLVDG